MKRILRLITGFTLLFLGIIGLFVPVLQGVLMIIAGLLILGPESKLVKKLLEMLRRRRII